MLVFSERFSLCSWSERTILNNPGLIKKVKKKKKNLGTISMVLYSNMWKERKEYGHDWETSE